MPPDTTLITILHTNDLHARIEQLRFISAMVKRIRKEVTERGGHTLLWDAGDGPDRRLLESDVTKGTAIIALMNAVGYDAAALGNADVMTYGPENLARLAEQLETADQPSIVMKQQNALQLLAAYRSALVEKQLALRQARSQLKAQEAYLEGIDDMEVSESEVMRIARYDPRHRRAVEVLEAFKELTKHSKEAAAANAPRRATQHSQFRLEAAQAKVDEREEELREEVMRKSSGCGADSIIMAVGVPEIVDDLQKMVRSGGVLNLFAGFSGSPTPPMDINAIHYSETVVTGTSGSNARHTTEALKLMTGKEIDLTRLISYQLPLAEIFRGLEIVRGREGMRVLIRPNG